MDDLADACLYLMEHFSDYGFVNVGTGVDLPIRELAALIQQTVGYEGGIVHDLSKPDGTPRKLMDVSKLSGMGWRSSIELGEGVRMTYATYLSASSYDEISRL